MKKILLLIIMLLGFTIYAQKVTNVSNRQEQSTIIVSYDLETKSPCKIALFVSTNGGATWQGPLKKVSGDVETNVSSGNKKITWSVLEEFEELRGNNIVFQVRASIETVIIGEQEWTTKNLNVTNYRNGDIIPEVKDPKEWAKLKTGAWCYYNNDPKNGKTYGKLYNWYAVNDPRGLAPEGYHVPTDLEWSTLIDYLGYEKIAGGKLKETGTLHWHSPNKGATNSSGFTGLPSGYRSKNGTFLLIGYFGVWWSLSESSPTNALPYGLDYKNCNVVGYDDSKKAAMLVRCIKD